MKPIHINADQPTDIGNVGEKNARIIDFALPAGWQDYATSTNTVAVFILPNTTLPVPYDVDVSSGSAHWLVTEYCTSAKGAGQVQLVLLTDATLADVVDEQGYFNANAEQIRAKSEIYDTVCHASAVESVPVNPHSPKFDHMMEVSD